MANVRVLDVVKKFGNVTAVDRVSVDFKEGNLTVLVGPSGCGKTTLLRMIAGLEDPTEGSILFGDRVVNEVPPWRRNIAMVFQNYALYPHMTVFDNIAYPLKSQKVHRQEIRDRVGRTAASLGIAELLKRKPKELSGGQMQRVALGRAIVRKPDVFLMDEPLSNLDAKLRVEMRAELKRLQKDLGVTTIYVTHDQAEAMTMADKLIVMRDGQIQQAGTPDELYKQPENRFVASFIGSPSMNFIPCHYDTGTAELVGSGFRLKVHDRFRVRLDGRQDPALSLGIRPESLGISPAPVSGGTKVRVYICEPLGRENLVTVVLGGKMIKALVDTAMGVMLDQDVYMTFHQKDMHLFDAETEETLLNGM